MGHTLTIVLLAVFLSATGLGYGKSARAISEKDTIAVRELLSRANELRNSDPATAESDAKQVLALADKKNQKALIGSAYVVLGIATLNLGKTEEAMVWLEQALEICKSAHDEKNLARAYNVIGLVLEKKGNYPEALRNYEIALQLREELKDQEGIAGTCNNIGNVYYDQGNYPKALSCQLRALKIREEIGDKNGMTTSHNNLGNIYVAQKDFRTASDHFSMALKLSEETQNTKGMAEAYLNIGEAYRLQENIEAAQKNYEACLKLAKEMNDLWLAANAYNNIGILHDYRHRYAEAMNCYALALKIKEETGDKAGMASEYINIGTLYLQMSVQQKKRALLGEAQEQLYKAKALAEETGFKEYIKICYKGLSEADTLKGDYNAALEHYKLYIAYRDSLVNEENVKKTVQAQMQYEFDKKEAATKLGQDKKDLEAREEKQQQQLIIGMVSAGLILVLAVTLVILRSLRQNQKKNRIITEQKLLVEKQKELVEEKQKEILDSIHYARKIQQALITPEKYMDKNLQRLMDKS